MTEQTYRVIQWATGHVGKAAIRHFVGNPVFDLVGVLVTNPHKVGKDAGEIAGIGPTGVVATDDMEAMVALAADCVFYAPLLQDIEMICRVLRSGKNVVATTGPFYPNEHNRRDGERIHDACRDGGTTFHSGGIHPGYAGDLLPLTLARIVGKIDKIQVFEIVNALADAVDYVELFGFGRGKDDFFATPNMLAMAAAPIFGQSMAMLVEGLGRTIDEITTELKVATATEDIPHATGVIRSGTVAAQHHEWTAWVDGAPLVVFHAVYTSGGENLEPKWEWGQTRYTVVIEGDPPKAHAWGRPSPRWDLGASRLYMDRDGRDQCNPRRLRRRAGLAHQSGSGSGETARLGPPVTMRLHHVVFTVTAQRVRFPNPSFIGYFGQRISSKPCTIVMQVPEASAAEEVANTGRAERHALVCR
jgi:hypothetical protein